jgi:hypothetical protein
VYIPQCQSVTPVDQIQARSKQTEEIQDFADKSLFANTTLNIKSRNLLLTCSLNTSRWNELNFQFSSRPEGHTIAFMETNPILSINFDGKVKYL